MESTELAAEAASRSPCKGGSQSQWSHTWSEQKGDTHTGEKGDLRTDGTFAKSINLGSSLCCVEKVPNKIDDGHRRFTAGYSSSSSALLTWASSP